MLLNILKIILLLIILLFITCQSVQKPKIIMSYWTADDSSISSKNKMQVSHQQYRKLSSSDIVKKLNKKALIMDVKNIYKKEDFSPNKELIYWQL